MSFFKQKRHLVFVFGLFELTRSSKKAKPIINQQLKLLPTFVLIADFR